MLSDGRNEKKGKQLASSLSSPLLILPTSGQTDGQEEEAIAMHGDRQIPSQLDAGHATDRLECTSSQRFAKDFTG